MWTIFYSARVIHGESHEEWMSAPDDDVQYVVEWYPYEAAHLSPWAGVWDRHIQTGVDEYSVNGWPVKRGRWMDYDEYMRLGEVAFRGRNNAIR